MKHRIKIVKKRSGETSYYPQYSYSRNILGMRKWYNYLEWDKEADVSWDLSFDKIEEVRGYLDKRMETEKRAVLGRRNNEIISTKHIKYS